MATNDNKDNPFFLPPPHFEKIRASTRSRVFHDDGWFFSAHRGRMQQCRSDSGGNVSSSELIVSKIDGPLLNLLIDEQDDANPPLHRYYCAMMAPFRHFVSSHVCTGAESLQRCSKFKISDIKNRTTSLIMRMDIFRRYVKYYIR